MIHDESFKDRRLMDHKKKIFFTRNRNVRNRPKGHV
jgi:hypothetical protein